jgi:hypothetical protein
MANDVSEDFPPQAENICGNLCPDGNRDGETSAAGRRDFVADCIHLLYSMA